MDYKGIKCPVCDKPFTENDERNCKILRTDTDGTVAVTTDGNTYSVYTWSAENGISPAA